MRSLLVPIDGSGVSDGALDFAIARAKAAAAELVVVYSVNLVPVEVAFAAPYGYADPEIQIDALEQDAADALKKADESLRAAGVSASTVQLEGDPAAAIVRYVSECHADAIIMGTSARTGFERFALGSVAEHVVRSSKAPVFVVPAQCERAALSAPLAQILLATDGSPASGRALEAACEFAELEQGRIKVCTVVDRPENVALVDAARTIVETAKARIEARGTGADSKILSGQAAQSIVTASRSHGSNVVFMGTHGRGGIARALLGSVAESVLRSSSIPVCIVR